MSIITGVVLVGYNEKSNLIGLLVQATERPSGGMMKELHNALQRRERPKSIMAPLIRSCCHEGKPCIEIIGKAELDEEEGVRSCCHKILPLLRHIFIGFPPQEDFELCDNCGYTPQPAYIAVSA